MQLCPPVFPLARPQNLCHTQTDRYFVKKVKLYSGHTIMCKTIENRKLTIFMIPMISSYIEK